MRTRGGLPFERRKKPDPEAVAREIAGNAVAFSIRSCKERTQGRLAEDSVTGRARRMHAENSFVDWDQLSEDDKELWRHLARVELLGGDGGPSPAPRRRP